MISSLSKSLRLTVTFCLFFSIFYIFILWLFAQAAGLNKGNAELATLNGKVVGTANIGQNFTRDIYFWGHPFHVGDDYDASSLVGSNKGPLNGEHLALLEERIDAFLVHHPYLTREKIPAEIIMANSSGLDPHISPKAAYAQAKRAADVRGWSKEKIMGTIDPHVEKPLLGMFGTEKASVLKLNAALDQTSNNK